jgi:hypothetical protein
MSLIRKPNIGELFSFPVRTAKSGEGPISLQKCSFSLNLWTAVIHYGSENALISGPCNSDGEAYFAIDVG